MSEKTMAFILVVPVLISMVLLVALGRLQAGVGERSPPPWHSPA